MNLSASSKRILLIHLHETINEYSRQTADHIQHNRPQNLINYPPNVELTAAEKEALAKLADHQDLNTALRKVLASSTADVLFDFFNLVDGTADPHLDSGDWNGVLLIDYPDEEPEVEEMLHDDFYSTYWEWSEITTHRQRKKP